MAGDTLLAGVAGQPKALTFLAYLAASRDVGVSRDDLLLAFWPDSKLPAAKASLKQLLYHLRRDTSQPQLFIAEEVVRLNPAVVEVDLWQYWRLLDRGDLEQAAAIAVEGHVLEGLPLSDDLAAWRLKLREEVASGLRAGIESAARSTDLVCNGEQYRELERRVEASWLWDDVAPLLRRMTELSDRTQAPYPHEALSLTSAASQLPPVAQPPRSRWRRFRVGALLTAGSAGILAMASWKGPALPSSPRAASWLHQMAILDSMSAGTRAMFLLLRGQPEKKPPSRRVAYADTLVASAPTVRFNHVYLAEALFLDRRIDSARSIIARLIREDSTAYVVPTAVRFEILMASGDFREAYRLVHPTDSAPERYAFPLREFRALMAMRDSQAAFALAEEYVREHPGDGFGMARRLGAFGFRKGLTPTLDSAVAAALGAGRKSVIGPPLTASTATDFGDEGPGQDDIAYQRIAGGEPSHFDISPDLRWGIELPMTFGDTTAGCATLRSSKARLPESVELAVVLVRYAARCGLYKDLRWALELLAESPWPRRPGLPVYYWALFQAAEHPSSCQFAVSHIEEAFRNGVVFQPWRFAQPEFDACWGSRSFREAIPTKEFLDRAKGVRLP